MSRLTWLSTFALILIASTCPAQTDSGETIDLRPKWNVGQEFYIEGEFVGSYANTPSRQMPPSDLGDTFGVFLQVTALHPDGSFTIELRGDRVKTYEAHDGITQSFDSDVPNQPIEMRDPRDQLDAADVHRLKLAAWLGHDYEIDVSNTGRVTDVRGIDALAKAAREMATNAAQRAWASELYAVGPEMRRWEALFAFLPFGEVRVGDQWSRVVNTYSGPVRLDCRLVSCGENAKTATVQFEKRESDSAQATDERSRTAVHVIRQSYEARGFVEIDLTTGFVASVRESGEKEAVKTDTPKGSEPGRVWTTTCKWTSHWRVLSPEERQREKEQARQKAASPEKP